MSRASFACIAFGVILLLLPPATFAYDNNGSTNLQQSQGVNQQLLASTVTQMASQTNDPQLQALAAQFQQAITSGNTAAEQSALANLQNYGGLAGESPALSALLKSMTSTGNGITVNPSTLASLLGAFTPNSQGVPSNMLSENPAQLASDLSSIMNLMNGVDPSLASQLLNEVGQMSLSIPSVSSLPSLPSLGSKGIVGLPVKGLSVAGAGSPTDLLQELALPAAIAVVAAALFIFRNRFRGLLGGQALPTSGPTLELDEYRGPPGTPRARVINAFNRMLRTMSGRGVVRERAETHREFSTKCTDRQEGRDVKKLSGYYEKAKFSAAEVTEEDAGGAEGALSAIESQPGGTGG